MATHVQPLFDYIDTTDRARGAIDVLAGSEYLILDCEGRDIGRIGGALSLLCIGTAGATHIFVFDVLRLPSTDAVMQPLLSMLADPAVPKIVWDGRQDNLEISESYGVLMRGVVDLQLVEVVSRGLVRGEREQQRIHRLATGRFSAYGIAKYPVQYQDMHLVLGMQKCLDENGLSGGVHKDEEVIAMHKANGSALWMARPLSQRLLQYAANDIYLIAVLHEFFRAMRWLSVPYPPLLLQQCDRYIRTQIEQGRTDAKNPYRAGAVVPLDVLTTPDPPHLLHRCVGCCRMLSLRCYEFKAKGWRRVRCRLCHVVGTKSRIQDETWLKVY